MACPDDLRPAIELGRGQLRVVVEVTERAVAGDPSRLLATVAQARQAGWGVALDDVGAAPASLAVLPFVRPDPIKLDMRLLQGRTTAEAAHIVNTVRARRNGPTPWSSPRASRPSSTPARPWPPGPPSARGSCSATRRRCPRSCRRPVPPSPSGRPRWPPGPPPPGRWWRPPGSRAWPPRTPATRSRYEFLATRAAFTGALGHGMPVSPVAGVRGADLAAGDPLRGEWDLVVIGPRFAAALVAKDRGDEGPDTRRRFDVLVTHDRDLVIRAAEPMLRRLVPEP